VAGRLQGNPRPSHHPPIRLNAVAAAVVVAALFGSAVTSAIEVRRHVATSVARDSQLSPAERVHAAGDRLGLAAGPFDAFRATLRGHERYAVDVPAGAKGPFITRGAVVRAYAAFFFLPAVQLPRADRVFHYRFR
jgi:hypothetical protein